MVEDHRRRQPHPGEGAEAVAQLQGRQGVEAQLGEGALGVDLGGVSVAEHRGGLGADQLGEAGQALCLLQGGEPVGEPAAPPAPARGADQLAQHGRQDAQRGEPAQGGRFEGEGERAGATRRQGGVEQGEALLVAHRGDPGAAQALQAGLAEPGAHRALGAPVPPGDRGRLPAPCAQPLGERVAKAAGGGVVALPGGAEGARGGGVEDEVGELGLLGQLGKRPGGVGLGGEDGVKALG